MASCWAGKRRRREGVAQVLCLSPWGPWVFPACRAAPEVTLEMDMEEQDGLKEQEEVGPRDPSVTQWTYSLRTAVCSDLPPGSLL